MKRGLILVSCLVGIFLILLFSISFVSAVACIDSDGGKNYTVGGKVYGTLTNGSWFEIFDSCKDTNTILEKYCSGTASQSITYLCSSEGLKCVPGITKNGARCDECRLESVTTDCARFTNVKACLFGKCGQCSLADNSECTFDANKKFCKIPSVNPVPPNQDYWRCVECLENSDCNNSDYPICSNNVCSVPSCRIRPIGECNPENIIVKLTAETNANVAVWDYSGISQDPYPYALCCDLTGEHTCDGENLIMRLYGETDSLAEVKNPDPYCTQNPSVQRLISCSGLSQTKCQDTQGCSWYGVGSFGICTGTPVLCEKLDVDECAIRSDCIVEVPTRGWTGEFPERQVDTQNVFGTGADIFTFNMTGNVLLMHMNQDWRDYSGNNLHGTPAGNPSFSTSVYKVGNASGLFTGAGTKVILPKNISVNPNTFSFSAWIRPIGKNSDQIYNGQVILNLRGQKPIEFGWCEPIGAGSTACMCDTNSFKFYTGSGGIDTHLCSAKNSVPVNIWTHVVATFDGTTKKIYLNGVLVNSAAAAIPNEVTKESYSNIISGDYFSPSSTLLSFNGTIDEMAFWNRSLSATEIASIYTHQKDAYSNPVYSTGADIDVCYDKLSCDAVTVTEENSDCPDGSFGLVSLTGQTKAKIAPGNMTAYPLFSESVNPYPVKICCAQGCESFKTQEECWEKPEMKCTWFPIKLGAVYPEAGCCDEAYKWVLGDCVESGGLCFSIWNVSSQTAGASVFNSINPDLIPWNQYCAELNPGLSYGEKQDVMNY